MIKKNGSLLGLAVVAGILVGGALDGTAQQFNQPFTFKHRGGAGTSVGMSPAHRQIILEQELLDRRADNPVIRDNAGFLLDVVEQNSQAFVRAQASPFLPGVASRGVRFIGIGSGGSGTFFGTGGASISLWIASLGESGTGGMGYFPAQTGTPIDSWIYQLNGLEALPG